MKTIYRTLMSLMTLVSIASCVKVELSEERVVELTASMEYEAETRTSLSGLENGMYYPLWSAGDEIAVFVDDDLQPSKFALKSGEGTTVASFTGTQKGERYVALYPYDMAGTMSEGTLSLTLPQTQKYVPDSFGQNAFPMLAVGGSDGMLKFMNLCSVLKISLTGRAAIRNITLTSNDENTFMSGPATVVTDYTASTEDILAMSSESSRSVVLETKGLEIAEDAPADVFIVIPSQTYKGGFTIEVDTYTEKVTKTVSSDITFERSQIRAITNFELDSEVPDIIPEAIPDNEIWYRTVDNQIYDIYHSTNTYGRQPFDAQIISHTYENGIGKIICDNIITKISDSAFGLGGGRNLSDLYLPDSIEEIGTYAIRGNHKLTTLRIPKNLKYVGSGGISGNKNLESFTGSHISEDGRCVIIEDGFMPNYGGTKTPVKNYLAAFAPAGITEYTLPSNVEILGWYAFAWCPELPKITFNEGLKTIMGDCFYKSHLDCEIILPSTLESLDPYAFHSCSGIKGFYGNEKFHTSDHLCLIFEQTAFSEPEKNGKWINRFVGYDITDYSIPEGIVGVENYSFDQMPNLKTVTLPSSLAEVGAYAFNHCDNLEALYGECVSDDHKAIVFDTQFRKLVVTKDVISYTIPDDITSIGYCAFTESPEIETITMGDQISHIEGYAFSACPNLKSITLSAGLKDMSGYNAFLSSDNLETIYCRALIPPSYYDYQMSEFPNLKFYVPEQSLALYQNHAGWAPFKKYFIGYNYTDLSEIDTYISSDYSNDGKVATLQTATKGNGIDIVLMGDAYSDRQIADGTYEADMVYMYDNLFTQEPFKTHKDMFNVYYVNVVSATEEYDNSGSALGGYFGEGTLVGGNDNKCFEYALNAITEDEMDEALIIVAMNSDAYAGTCYMYYPGSAGTYGSGPAVAYFPKGGDQTTFAQLLHHEANGHGFAKLADEYAYEDMGAVPSDYVTDILDQQNNWGWWKNVDFTDDPKQVRWANFLEDERYANKGLGLFEGGLTYWTGVWRPTETSIMVNNAGEFNAPSREAIYYRIHKLAYGDSWEYDYEKFVEYDAVNRTSASADAPRKRRTNYVEKSYEPLAPPVIVGKTWKEAQK